MMHVCPRDGCSQVFTRKANLEGHLNAHDGLQPYQCTLCNARFTRRNDQRAHEREQHSDTSARQSFSCQVCGATFPRKSTLNRHLGIPMGLRRCPKEAIAHVQALQHTDSTMAGWPSSLSSRIVQPAWPVIQHKSNDDNDDEHRADTAAQRARQRFMPSTGYARAKHLTEYRASTDDFYDWTVVAFKAAVSSHGALHALLIQLDTQNPVDNMTAAIAISYDRIMHSTVTIFTKAPLQLTITVIVSLLALDGLRHNDEGEHMLQGISEGIESKTARQRSMNQHPPNRTCVTGLIEVSEQLRQDCGRVLALQPVCKDTNCNNSDGDEAAKVWRWLITVFYALFSGYVASFFAFWARKAATQGLNHQAEVAEMLSDRFFVLRRELVTAVGRFVFDSDDSPLTLEQLNAFSEL